MANSYITIGSNGTKKKIIDMGDGLYGDAVRDLPGVAATEQVLAAATGSDDGLGKIGTIANAEWMYVRCPTTGYSAVDWRVQSDKQFDYQLLRARSIVDTVTVTLDSIADGEKGTINGVEFAAEDTATDALRSAHKFYTGGADATADAAQLVLGINAGHYLTLDTVLADTTVTINGKTYTAKATADVAAGEFSQAGTDTQDAASLVLCINHADNVTCASANALDTVTVNGIVMTGHATTTTISSRQWDIADNDTAAAAIASIINDKATITLATAVAGDTVTINGLTFMGKASTAVASQRRFSIDTGDNETAVSLAALINDSTYGVPGVTAVAASAVITLTPDYGTSITCTGTAETITYKQAYGVEGVTAVAASAVVTITPDSADYSVALSSSNSTRLAVETANGVPGVLATSNAAEVDIVCTTADSITISTSAPTIAYGTYGIPGVTASSALGVVTIVPKATDGASVIYSVTGTAAAHWAVANGTLAVLTADAAAVADVAANNTTAGTIYAQDTKGYEYCYFGYKNDSGGDASAAVVGATLRS